MKKIPSLFKRDYEDTGLVYDEVVDGSEWVLDGEGTPTVKIDGTSCMIRDGSLYKRYDRKVTKKARKRGGPYTEADCKSAPDGWEACEEKPNGHTGHWPGWVVVGNGPNDKYHIEAWRNLLHVGGVRSGTYELVGPKLQSNPHGIDEHRLVPHGQAISQVNDDALRSANPRTFEEIKQFLSEHSMEGIVWHHSDGRMVKIKSRDFGIEWPRKDES